MTIWVEFVSDARRIRRFLRGIVGVSALALSLVGVAPAQSPDSGVVTAQVKAVTPQVEAYAQVEPISVLPVSAAETGVVTALRVVPGMHVQAGQELARLTGPAINALLLQSEAEVRSADAQLTASKKALAIEQEQLPSHLSTKQAVQQAESAVAQAQTRLDNADSKVQSVHQMMTVSAPESGIVLKLDASNGALVSAGQPILTLQPANDLWLRATYYGTDLAAIRVGMTGQFSPSDHTGSIPVKVTAISGTLSPSGGESVAMVSAAPKPDWMNGQFGTVRLNAPQRVMVAVPTRALIIDRGKWWVLIHTAKGDQPQEVVPGPAQGWDTLIEQGLKPGTQVVVENAYLLFHSAIGRHYQPPD